MTKQIYTCIDPLWGNREMICAVASNDATAQMKNATVFSKDAKGPFRKRPIMKKEEFAISTVWEK